MNDVNIFGDLIKIFLPAAAVLYGMYLVTKSFLNKEFERRLVELKIKNTDVILPIRLQAYERMALFLERIAPSNLVVRVNDANYTAAHFQQLLLHEIREEFNHNLSQQVYMSEQTWKKIRNAKDEVAQVINQAYKDMPNEARSVDLAKRVFDILMQRETDPVEHALISLKSELQKLF